MGVEEERKKVLVWGTLQVLVLSVCASGKSGSKEIAGADGEEDIDSKE